VPLPPELTPKTILIVESEPLLLRFVRTILEAAGFAVLSAATAEAAIRVDHDFTGDIDLLLTCFSMAGSSGAELTQELEWRRPRLRAMLMSSDPAAQTLALNHGWYFAEKPFLPSALLGKIKNALSLDVGVAGARS
jgi:two-component system, cell cycle sensor histidine kinase and response regulator CckA